MAVFDFDVHHGNGTEDILARTFDPRFMYCRLHATGEDVFPGSGRRARPDHPGVLNAPHRAEKVVTTEWVLEEALAAHPERVRCVPARPVDPVVWF